jgi:RimJ/RimL family protein N-acetyltransferase
MENLPDEIHTERLILHKVCAEDIPLYRDILCSPEMMANIGPVYSETEAQAKLDQHIANWDKYGLSIYVLQAREDNAPIGFVGFGGPEDHDFGWMIKPGFQGQGYAFEAVSACIDYLRQYPLQDPLPLKMSIQPANKASIRLAEKLGAKSGDSEMYKGNLFINFYLPLNRPQVPKQALQLNI